MSFDPGLERKFKGMFSQKRLYQKLRKFQETHTLDNSDDESGENAEKRSTQQPEDKTSSTPQASDTSNEHSDQTTEETKKDPRIQQMDEEGRTRYVQRWWPRDPHGPIYGQGWPGGKMTSNGNPHWGATLLDFFATNRVPSIDNFVLFSSGSRLAAFTRRLGEKECAWSQAELEWADAEEDPKQLFPVDMAQLITSIDTRVQMRIGRSMPKPTESTPEVEIDPAHPFKPQNYPDPWPVVPFTAPFRDLESHLPLHILPEKLIVHDPWGVLHAHHVPDDKIRWEDKSDIVYTYHLALSSAGRAKRQKSKEDALKEWSDKCEKRMSMMFESGHDVDENGLVDCPVSVELPPPPRPITEVPEAHVYLSPAKYLGSGHHSYVYDVEWELPRSVFFEPKLCQLCVNSAVEKVVKERFKDSAPPRGTLVSEMELVKPGVTAELMTKSELYRDIPGSDPSSISGLANCPEDVQPPQPPGNSKRMLDITEPEYRRVDTYSGDIIGINRDEIDIQYQYPHTGLGPCCKHMRSRHPHPLTATVRVTAKISKKYDNHLEKEARNYQNFPSHFFEHWNGYNLVNPIHDPVPVGAVVPQFYGYYKPDPDQKFVRPSDYRTNYDDYDSDSDDYLSPILLLENCGQQIDVDELNHDEKNECASLFYRMHSAGWLHQSVFSRNVLIKKGSLFESPIFRSSQDHRFRLIDFGRSTQVEIPEGYKNEKFFHRMTGVGNGPVKHGEGGTRMQEEMDVARCFRIPI